MSETRARWSRGLVPNRRTSGRPSPATTTPTTLAELATACARSQPMIVHQRIEMRADVMLGKPVIRGTRVTVELVRRKLAEGITLEDLLDAYPRLTRDDIHAAMPFAADARATGACLEALATLKKKARSAAHRGRDDDAARGRR